MTVFHSKTITGQILGRINQQLLESWLELQCRAMAGVCAARVRVGKQEAELGDMVATWPPESTVGSELDDLLDMAYRSRGAVVAGPMKSNDEQSEVLRLAQPIEQLGEAVGAVAVTLSQVGTQQQAAVLRLLQWGNAWLELLWGHALEVGDDDKLTQAMQRVLQPQSFQEAAMSLVSFLAHHFSCERVSLGLNKRDGVRIVALSDSADIAQRGELAQRLGDAMTEALGEGGSIAWHADADAARPAHQALAQAEADTAVLTVVLEQTAGPFGALSFEARGSKTITGTSRDRVLRIVRLLGPVLALKRAQEEPLYTLCQRRLVNHYRSLTHRRQFVRYIGLMALLAVLAVLLFGTSVHRVGGPAEVQGEVHRALIAPFDGYVAAAYARAGETVDSGFVVAELDDKDLRLEHRQLVAEKTELDKQYRKALAALDRAQARILNAQIAQADARIALLAQQLKRTRLTAPFTGMVVSGDLSRSLGKPVNRGEVLFEIAPLETYRVAIEVPDRDIQAITTDQPGTLVLAALPTARLPIEVVNITSMPSPTVEPGTFRVEARLTGPSEALRPGMRGVAKIEVGRRSRWWIWTHELVDWLRYQLWAWAP